MLLAIDSGNTNIVFAVFDGGGEVQGEWRAATDSNRTADEFGVWLEQLMQRDGLDRTAVTSAIIATVVPDTRFHLIGLCRKYFHCEPLMVGANDLDLGIGVLVDHPEEVGADRLCNAVGAHRTYGGPLVVLDFGTATTFDVVDEDGNYRGGVIAPGLNLSLEALHAAAAQLPRVAVETPEKVIGTSTVPMMHSGVFWGNIAMIEGLVRRIEKEFGAKMTVIATGGHAQMFADACAAIDHFDPDLTLRGLLSIYRQNRND